MKIAYLIAHLGQTGVNRVVLDLISQMIVHSHKCSVFYMEQRSSGLEFPCETILLKDWGQLSVYDIVHVHGLKPEIFVLKNRWMPLHRLHGVKFITTLHCYCFQDFTDLYGKMKGVLMGCFYLMTKLAFDKVVCLSKDMMHYYEQWIPSRKLTYAYNTRDVDVQYLEINDEDRKMVQSFKGNDTLIGMNCVLIYRKGIDLMLKAMALLPASYKLIVMGEGKEHDTFQQMAQELGLGNRVFFAGQRHDAFRFLPYYDIYAMPSRSEGFPLVLLEAATYGTKVVASNLPVVKECFTDDEVVTFDMPDAQTLADAIVYAKEKKDLGDKLKQRFIKDYAPTSFYQRYIGIYEG